MNLFFRLTLEIPQKNIGKNSYGKKKEVEFIGNEAGYDILSSMEIALL